MISANYFDHQQGRLHMIWLDLQDTFITLNGEGVSKHFSRQELHVDEVFMHAPCVLNFADGSHCEVHDAAHKQSLLAWLNHQPSWVQRWQKKWLAALLAIMVMSGMLFAAYQWGVPVLADIVAERLPVSYERVLGAELMTAIDKSFMEPSKLSDQKIARAEQLLRRLRPKDARVPIHLEVRYAPRIGANAFALPGGTVVVTDQLIDMIVGYGGNDLEGYLADELSGVLAHEIGHVQKNHAMRRLSRDAMITVIAGTLFGDFSSVVALAPTAILNREYSREMEIEADIYAIERLIQLNISPSHLADALETMQNQRGAGSKIPPWLRASLNYSSTHPPAAERIARMRAAAL
ncbi:M48 family metallopeptidase [Undibacterium sp. TJN19]|uniref:M48 family metallopeptidase n=1 Tax=Undibacterium sp. TJN19 TaxID=3413055 RepID=UPI003BF1E660